MFIILNKIVKKHVLFINIINLVYNNYIKI